MNNLLLDALKCADRGWYVFPAREREGAPYLNKKGKQVIPRVKSPYTKNGLKNATIDHQRIREMWKRFPKATVAINCGMSNLFVIDIDRKGKSITGNFVGLTNFMKLGISVEGALVAITPSGGLHYYFSGTGKTSSNEATQIDTRSMGGYVIAPPSAILSENGERLSYLVHGDWDREPVSIAKSAFEKLGLTRKKKSVSIKFKGANVKDERTVARVRAEMIKLPVSLAYDYNTWLEIGMSLKNLGEIGFKMWSWWTEKYFVEKPDSRRVGELERKWSTFHEDGEIGIGTFFRYARQDLEKS